MLLLFSAESRLHFAFLFQTLLYGGFLAILYEAFHLFLEIAAATAAFFPFSFSFIIRYVLLISKPFRLPTDGVCPVNVQNAYKTVVRSEKLPDDGKSRSGPQPPGP